MSQFNQLVKDTAEVLKDVPQAIMGVSGTDSFLAFMICSKAYALLGDPGRLLGIHFCSDEYMWNVAVPWLYLSGSDVEIVRDSVTDPMKDGARWGHLMDIAVYDGQGHYRRPEDKCWVIGSRNKTERLLGKYSNASRMASFEPLYHVWKSEVLDMCKELGMPKELIQRSYIANCGCGDSTADTLAFFPKEVDECLNHLELTGTYAGRVDVIKAIKKHQQDYGFKANLPVRLPSTPTIVNVNPLVISSNKLLGLNHPPLRVRQGREGVDPICVHELTIQGPCRIIHDPEVGLNCGANVWIETDSEVIVNGR